jgi:hypothetical protein
VIGILEIREEMKTDPFREGMRRVREKGARKRRGS